MSPLQLLLAALLTSTHAHARILTASPPDAQKDTHAGPFSGPGDAKLSFPADWSRKAYPIPVAAHNNYWSDVPVLEALSYGIMSVESDVWLHPVNKELYVGHDSFSLSRTRTFQSITIEPLLAALEQANAANSRHTNSSEAEFFAPLQEKVNASSWNGYWSLGPGSGAAIQLLVDVKTDGLETWPYVVKALEPLRQKGWLTRYEDGKIINGAVTVIGTGNTPVSLVAPLPQRDYFIDGPLGALTTPFEASSAPGSSTNASYSWNSTLCPMASVDFATFSPAWKGLAAPGDDVRKNLTAPVEEAHALGIKSRYWDTPAWPIYARDAVNTFLLDIGSDWINADDLEAISKF